MDMIDMTSACARTTDVLLAVRDDQLDGRTPCERLTLRELVAHVGGLGTAIGPVLGSFLITPLSELLRSYLGNSAAGLHLVIYSFGLIIVMLYFPAGLAGALSKLSRQRRSP